MDDHTNDPNRASQVLALGVQHVVVVMVMALQGAVSGRAVQLPAVQPRHIIGVSVETTNRGGQISAARRWLVWRQTKRKPGATQWRPCCSGHQSSAIITVSMTLSAWRRPR